MSHSLMQHLTTRNLIYGDTILVGVKKFATIGYISPRLSADKGWGYRCGNRLSATIGALVHAIRN